MGDDTTSRRIMAERLRAFIGAFDGLTLEILARASGLAHPTLSKLQTGRHAWSTRNIWTALVAATGTSTDLVEGYFDRGDVTLSEFVRRSAPAIRGVIAREQRISSLLTQATEDLKARGADPDFVAAAKAVGELVMRQVGDSAASEDERALALERTVEDLRDMTTRHIGALKSGRYATKTKRR